MLISEPGQETGRPLRDLISALWPLLLALLLGSLVLLLGRCGGGATEGVACTGVTECRATGTICAGGTCTACGIDAQCATDYGAGATCVEGVCQEATCPQGTVGCACKAGGACDAGECLDGACVDCERGAVACACFDNGTCGLGARCGAGNLCEACPAGEEGCPCDQGACAGTLVCQNDVCAVDPCPAGTEGCPCTPDDACDGDLRCGDDGQCAPCTNDLVGCPCDDGACSNHLVCDDVDDTCRASVACADAGCVLHQLCVESPGVDAVCQAACEPGYTWNAAACEPIPAANCDEGAAGSILALCQAAHRECTTTTGGAECAACLVGFTDEGGRLAECRAVATCDDQQCQPLNRTCVPAGEHTDAACGDCIDGYEEEAGTGTCVVASTPNCEPDLPGSLLAICLDQNRTCVVDPESGEAACGDCVEGYAPGDLDECVPAASCAELGCALKNRQCLGAPPFQFCGDCVEGTIPSAAEPDVCAPPLTCLDLACPDDQFCAGGGPSANASCVDAPCDPGQAWSENEVTGAGTCLDCTVNCGDDAGETGRIWLYTLAGGLGGSSCICETENGFYWDDGERRPKPCDDDGDGWVRVAARDYVTSDDDALADNARCRVRAVDRFTLRNEYKQFLDVRLCADGTLQAAYDGVTPCATTTVALYESVRNDDQDLLDVEASTLAPAYAFADPELPAIGRRLRAEEVNSLTKACTQSGDYNDNDASDLAEWHGMPDLAGDAGLFARFAYFVELANGYHTDNDAPGPGRWVIEERTRCPGAAASESVPFVYAEGEADYWRQCTRGRDAAFDPTDGPATPDFGMDFARWSCDTAKGGCPLPPPPTRDTPEPGVQPANGLCQVPLPPLDPECADEAPPWPCVQGAAWRGLSHHSQFRCVQVTDEDTTDAPSLQPAHFVEEFHLNRCRVVCPPSDPDCAQDCSGATCASSSEAPFVSAPNPWYPVLACQHVESPQPGAVGFALVRHRDLPPPYVRGCVNEWTPDAIVGPANGALDPVIGAWRGRCPGWLADPDGTIGQGDPNDFGRLQCGCGTNYGGPSCDLGCPSDELHTNPGYVATPRQGWWMCGRFGAAGYPQQDPVHGPALVGEDGAGSTWVLRGEVPLNATDARPLCEEAEHCLCSPGVACETSGYVLR